MQRLGKILLSGGVGGLVGAALSFGAFLILSLLDSATPGEAVAFGALAGFTGGFFGLLVGVAVSIGRLGVLGGALVGAAATLLIVLAYVVGIGRPGEYGSFLRQSLIIVIIFALPTVGSGIAAGLLNRAVSRA